MVFFTNYGSFNLEKYSFLPAFKLQTISPFGKFAMVTHNSRQVKRL